MRIIFALATTCAMLSASWALAGEAVLTLRAADMPDRVVAFDMAQIEAMPQVSFRTTTVWTDGAHEFSGPTLAHVVESLGASSNTTIRARAINDYVVEIPVESLEQGAPIIATRIDGAPFSRREKGPLWIVYPYDSDARFQTESIYGRSIWQLVELSVE